MSATLSRAETACEIKQGFRTEEEARTWARDWIRAGRSTEPVLFTYWCRFCGRWHMTRRHDDQNAAGITADALYARPTLRFSASGPTFEFRDSR